MTEINMIKSFVGSVTPLFEFRRWRSNGENTNDCVYFAEEEGVYLSCQEAEFNQLKECKKNEEKARTNGVNCDRFVDLSEARSAVDVANDQLNKIERNEEALKEAKQAYVYSISLDSVSEQSIYEIDRELSLMNGAIQQGYEALGKEGGPKVPSLIREFEWVAKNQCVNK